MFADVNTLDMMQRRDDLKNQKLFYVALIKFEILKFMHDRRAQQSKLYI